MAVSDRGRSGLAALQLHKGEGVLTLFHSPPPGEDTLIEAESDSDQHQEDKDIVISGSHHHHHRHHDHKARLQRGDPPVNVSGWVLGSSQPLWVRYMSGCCSLQAELLVWDGAGNMKRCPLSSGQQGQRRDRITESNGTGRISPTGICLVLLGLLWSSLL